MAQENKNVKEKVDEVPTFHVSNIETKHEPTDRSNDEILRIFNKRRQYCPSDFKPQTFIPKLPKDI